MALRRTLVPAAALAERLKAMTAKAMESVPASERQAREADVAAEVQSRDVFCIVNTAHGSRDYCQQAYQDLSFFEYLLVL